MRDIRTLHRASDISMRQRRVPISTASGRNATMRAVNTQPNLAAADDFYDELIGMHRGLTDAQSALVNAKLILLLANHIGDLDVLRAAMAAAREDIAITGT